MNSNTIPNSNEWSEMKIKGKCPNQYVGTLANFPKLKGNSSKKQKKFSIRENIAGKTDKKQSIILILESPHKDEFKKQDNGTWEAIGPANGTTGNNIIKYIRSLMECCFDLRGENHRNIKWDDIELYLVNAIPYQCSLGNKLDYKNKKERNRRFTALWNKKEIFQKVSSIKDKSGEDYFIQTLSKIYQSGDIIINCCTSFSPTENEPKLQELVQSAIDKVVKGNNAKLKFISTHPSGWWSKNNRYVWRYNCKRDPDDKENCLPFL